MSIRTRLTIILTFAALVIVGAVGSPARASLAPGNPVVTGSGSDFTWTMQAFLFSGEKTVAGDFLTVDGIAGYITGTTDAPSGFSASVTKVGSLSDITWTALGTTKGADLLTFGYQSTFGAPALGSYTYQDHSSKGAILTGSGSIQVPAAPEPSSFVSLGLCALVVLSLVLTKRNRRAPARRGALEAFA